MVNGAYGFPKILHLNYLTVIPFFHIFGLVRSLLTPLYTGSNNYICDEPKNFIHNFSIAHPDITCITPSLLEVICFFGEQNKQLLGGKLKFIVCGGAHIPQSLLIRAAKLGIYASSGYGSTETTNLVSGNRFSLKRPHSVGYLFPHQKIKIVNGEL
jgi:long-subunit acyl-CoA synthetase (AMP-forming)